MSKVTLSGSQLLVGGQPFQVKGIAYNPVPIDGSNADSAACQYDVPRIADMHANTISTYMCGYARWQQWTISTGVNFYKQLSMYAERYGLKIIVAYYSNQTVDWTDSSLV